MGKINIVKYASIYGDKDFNELPFNEVDSLILSQLSYLNYKGFVGEYGHNDPAVTLKSITQSVRYDDIFKGYFYEDDNRELIKNMVNSKRFGDLKLNCYTSVYNEEKDAQFSAVTYIMGDKSVYIAFRGTDTTILGWKEDIKLAYKRPTRAQELAVSYMNDVAESFSGPFMTGGHSKGGNLAVYAAMKCAPIVRERITAIYNNDGPGFRPEVVNCDAMDEIRGRIHKFIPKESVVGIIMNDGEPYDVIDSWGVGTLQHNTYTWKIEGTSLYRVSGMSDTKIMHDAALNEWINTLSESEIDTLVDVLYDILTASNAKSLFDLMDNPKSSVEAAYNAYKSMNENDKEIMGIILSRLKDIGKHMAKEEIEENAREGAAKIVEGVTEAMNAAENFWNQLIHNDEDKG